MPNIIPPPIGKRYGKLVILGQARNGIGGDVRWHCKCDCGKLIDTNSGNIRHGKTKSCGCSQNAVRISSDRKHKKCMTCKVVKPIEEFHAERNRVDGHSYKCKSCTTIYATNRLSKRLAYLRQYSKNKRQTDVVYKITSLLRGRLRTALQNKSKCAKTLELLGCDVEYLRDWLESKFDENMSWDNHGTYWQIDHIKPCASFDLTKESEQRACFHYTNLQPLEKYENMRKGAKYYDISS